MGLLPLKFSDAEKIRSTPGEDARCRRSLLDDFETPTSVQRLRPGVVVTFCVFAFIDLGRIFIAELRQTAAELCRSLAWLVTLWLRK